MVWNPIDRESGASVTLDNAEADIHRGNAFTFHFQSSAPLPTAVPEETAVGFTTPTVAQSAKIIHMWVDALADDESTFEIREAPTVVLDQGTNSQKPIQRNRNLNASHLSVLRSHQAASVANRITTYNVAQAAAANLAASGLVLHTETLAVGGGAPFASVENTAAAAIRQWLLRPATDYVVILQNLTANDTTHHITLNWSETEPANYKP
jgi:hypothetical protein